MDLAMLAPDADDEPVMDLAMLAPDADDEPVMDLAMLAPDADDEPVMDLAMLAPDATSPSAEADTVMGVAALAAMPRDTPHVVSEIEEPVFDLAMLAPSAYLETEGDGDSAPISVDAGDAPPAEQASVQPTMVPEEERVFDLDALAPADDDLGATSTTGSAALGEGMDNGRMADEEASAIGFISSTSGPAKPDELVIDLDPLRVEPTIASAGPPPSAPVEVEISAVESTPPEGVVPDDGPQGVPDPVGSPSTPDADVPSDEQGEPIFTRTLAELYAAQGAVKQAVTVLRHLLAESPQDEGLARRITELESGAPITRAPRGGEPAALPGQDDEEVEELARELAESGRGSHDMDSPFAWTDRESAAPPATGPTIREYFDGLLKWEPRDS
jgi:hypothetical protein